jgi:hypothetical protein
MGRKVRQGFFILVKRGTYRTGTGIRYKNVFIHEIGAYPVFRRNTLKNSGLWIRTYSFDTDPGVLMTKIRKKIHS